MKTLAKIWKAENLKKGQKTFLAASILTISILPFISLDLKASGLVSKQPTQTFENQDSRMDALESELWTDEIEYRAQQFVEAEISKELQTRENDLQESPDESNIAETSKLEDLLRIAPYDASKYVEDEMSIEITNHTLTKEFLEEAELITIEGCSKEITRFTQTLVKLQEQKAESKNFATAISN